MHPSLLSWEFLDGHDLSVALPGVYDPFLVALSVVMACLAAYVALELAERIGAAHEPGAKRLRLATGVAALGIGVWAVHFLGMLAFSLPIPVRYDVLITLGSVVPAMLASGIMLRIISRVHVHPGQLILGGMCTGADISAMHYTGMAAVRLDAVMRADPLPIGASLLVTVGLATTALATRFVVAGKENTLPLWTRLGAALVMGFALAGMHYTGTAAVYFLPGDGSYTVETPGDPLWLGMSLFPPYPPVSGVMKNGYSRCTGNYGGGSKNRGPCLKSVRRIDHRRALRAAHSTSRDARESGHPGSSTNPGREPK